MSCGRRREEAGSEPGNEACVCDHERIFELADGSLGPDAVRSVLLHLEDCDSCGQLYEQELELNAYLGSEDFSAGRPACSVHRGVAMSLPTRSPLARLLWALLAGSLLMVAIFHLETSDTEPEMLAMGLLAACWGFVSGVVGVVRAVLAAAGPTILYILILGALADLLIAAAYVFASRRRRAREA